MFLHFFQIVTHFLYVCQSISWLTSLLKLDKYRDISCSWWDIFLKVFGDIPEVFFTLVPNTYKFLYVCQSFSWLICSLKSDQYRDISCPWWDIFLEIFGDIPWTFLHHFSIIINCLYGVSLLVSLLPYWNWTNIEISPVLDEIFSLNFFQTFLVCLYTISK